MTGPLAASEVERLRADTPGCAGVNHLNHAGASLPPSPVLETQVEHLRREAQIGGYEAADEAQAADDAVYASIARLIGAGPGEIARTEHATAAWNGGFWSVPMTQGQRIITAEAAYGANAVAFLRAEQRRGVGIDVVPSDAAGQVDIAELERRLDDDVALVAITHVPTNGGLVNPAAEVGRLTRSAGVPFLLDACQAVGQIDLDVDEIGCDLLSGTGRKYLRGPRGTGFLYVRSELLERLEPDHPDHHGAEWDRADGFRLHDSSRRFEHWEYSHAGWLALGTAVDYALEIGLTPIEATVLARADELRTRLSAAGLPVFDLGRDRCGIVTTNVPERDPTVVRDALRARSINTSVTTAAGTRWDFERRNLKPMLRVSVHYLTTAEELDAVVDALAELA